MNILSPQPAPGVIYRLEPATLKDKLGQVLSGFATPQCRPWENNPFLPLREVVEVCAKRFFEQIQSSLWLIAEDQFYTQLDLCYSDKREVESSWMCFLYALLSLTSPVNCKSNVGQNDRNTLTSEEYFSLSMNLLPTILQYPDLNGVRALITLVSFQHLKTELFNLLMHYSV